MLFKTPVNIDFTGCADDNTRYIYFSDIENVLESLQLVLEKMFYWFLTKHLVPIAGKCHLFTSSKTPVDIHVPNTEILNVEKS